MKKIISLLGLVVLIPAFTNATECLKADSQSRLLFTQLQILNMDLKISGNANLNFSPQIVLNKDIKLTFAEGIHEGFVKSSSNDHCTVYNVIIYTGRSDKHILLKKGLALNILSASSNIDEDNILLMDSDKKISFSVTAHGNCRGTDMAKLSSSMALDLAIFSPKNAPECSDTIEIH